MPTRAASTGLTLMKMPKKLAGTRRSASRSARNGTADDSTPAASAHARAAAGAAGAATARRRRPAGTAARTRPRRRPSPAAPGSRAPDRAVEQDVAAPAHGGQQRERRCRGSRVLGWGRTSTHHGRPRRRSAHSRSTRRRDPSQRDGQRAEELQRDGQAEPDPVDRRVQRQVHRREHHGQPQHRPPLRRGERAQPRAARASAAPRRPPTGAPRPRRPAPAPERPGRRPRPRSGWTCRCRASAPPLASGGEAAWCEAAFVVGTRSPVGMGHIRRRDRMRKMHPTRHLYAGRMDAAALELRHLRCLVAIVDDGHLHRRRHRAGRLAGGRVPHAARAGADPGRAAAAPHQPHRHPDHGRRSGPRPRPPAARRRRRTGPRGHDRPHPAAHRPRLVGDGPPHRGVPAPLGTTATPTSSCT